MYSKFVLAIRFCLAKMAILYWLESGQWLTVISSSAVYSMCNNSPGQLTKYVHCMPSHCGISHIAYTIDIREKVGHRANRLEFGAAVRHKHMVTKKDLTNKRVLVKDVTVIRNKEDAVSSGVARNFERGFPNDRAGGLGGAAPRINGG